MRVAVLIAVAALAAGCGSKQNGPRLFARECAGCHSLQGHERGAMGGDLAIPLLSVPDLVSFAVTMPTRDRLTSGQAHAIAAFVRAREIARR